MYDRYEIGVKIGQLRDQVDLLNEYGKALEKLIPAIDTDLIILSLLDAKVAYQRIQQEARCELAGTSS
jgi:hypothetical protein